jgi:hypothetical protein
MRLYGMKEYNELTKRLLEEGYTADNHPNYVQVGRTCQEKDNPLHNLDGGFEYYRWYVYEKAFRTPCGLMCKGTSCMSSLCVNGVEWSFENDMATIHCPYHKCDCDKKDARLPKEGVLKDWCNVHMTEEEYRYEGSVEDIIKLWEDQIKRDAISFKLQHNGRVCENHMHYDRDKGEWQFHYDPGICAGLKCHGEFHHVGERGICPVLGRELCSENGNVFYDLKISFRRRDLDGTLFDGQIDTQIKKGIKVFNHPVSMDICRNYAKLCQDEIRWRAQSKYHTELFFAERYEKHEFAVEVLNIRAENRESRDLMQDLQDIKEGIHISHASDDEKREKEQKSEKRQQAKETKIKKMEKRLIDIGYENMDTYEQNRVCKLIDLERLDELEEIRQQKLKEEQEKPVQLSLFDMM